MDSMYRTVDSFFCSGGYKTTDVHDIELMPNGHALLLSYDTETVDMSKFAAGGDSKAEVVGAIVQEIDQNKKPVFTWRSWDHFDITDETEENLTKPHIDYVHANSIQIDTDGSILLSCRNMDEITKISRDSGGIIWRLGGKHNEFSIEDYDLGFSHQHHVRRIENGHITIFDNGNFHTPPHSRAIEYAVDEQTKTAKLVWSYRHAPDVASMFMGSVQRLPNGNTLIGWGGVSSPAATEVRPDGSIAYELSFTAPNMSYRAFRYPWNGRTQLPWLADVSASATPPAFQLEQCYPNPARASAHIVYRLAQPGRVQLKLYDLMGRELSTMVDESQWQGYHSADIDVSSLIAGVYRYVLVEQGQVLSRQMVVAR